MKNRIVYVAVLGALVSMYGCGGGSSSSSTTSSTSSTAASNSFPTGVSSASPTSLSASGGTVVASLSWPRRLHDFALALYESVREGDNDKFSRVLLAAAPFSSGYAAPAKLPEGQAMANYIQDVAAGNAIPDRNVLNLDTFFSKEGRSNCYGPAIGFLNHDDAPGNSGRAPGGDTGIWLSREGDQTSGKPCAAAQLDTLVNPIKRRTNATLLFGARMKALAGSNMPSAGNTVDLTNQVNEFFQTLLPTNTTGSVTSASIRNDSGVYTYLVETTSNVSIPNLGTKKMYVLTKVVHDGNSENFNGVVSYFSAHTGNVCGSNNEGVKADVGTMRYVKASAIEMNMAAREATYCTSEPTLGADFTKFAALTSSGELDPTKTGSAIGNPGQEISPISTGWAQQGQGFKRFASTINPLTHEGNYKFTWQAGVGDSHSRMFAMNIAYNSTTEVRTGQAFFGFAGAMTDTSEGSTNLKGMICNWAATPNPTHNPNNLFQYQKIVLANGSNDWDFSTDIGSNKISYAPTNSCNSSANMRYDVMVNNAFDQTKGGSVTNDLDRADSGKTVQQTIEARGFKNPNYF